jgi:hypothetical protein
VVVAPEILVVEEEVAVLYITLDILLVPEALFLIQWAAVDLPAQHILVHLHQTVLHLYLVY